MTASTHRLERLVRAIDALPEHLREAFLLRSDCGYGFEAVAQEMGITESMAKIYIARAFMAVQRQLDTEETVGKGFSRRPAQGQNRHDQKGRRGGTS